MRIVVAVTDNDWFHFLKERNPDEVNFWQPSARGTFRALAPGEPFLFKLHSPFNYIVGGGFFVKYSVLPTSLAWEAIGDKNGARSLAEMRQRVERYRQVPPRSGTDYLVGCIILCAPFLLDDRDWLPSPQDFPSQTQRYKGFDVSSPTGKALWDWLAVHAEMQHPPGVREVPGPTIGGDVLVRERLGQGAFRVLVTDAYARRCAVTNERVLPTLEAAHIVPVGQGGKHSVDNGLLLRSDVHRLFDSGYVTVTPDFRFLASRRLREEFENGEEYLQLSGKQIALPQRAEERPSRQHLEWHAGTVFVA
jgi:putative restriction endonuclease